MSLGAIPPIIGETRGSYALLGYKRGVGEVINWIQQVGKNSGQGVSEIRKLVPLQSKTCNNFQTSTGQFVLSERQFLHCTNRT